MSAMREVAGATAARSLVETRALTVEYRVRGRGRFTAVDEVSASIAANESVALIGESGSGKSSLARAICGLTPFQAGEIVLGEAGVFSAGTLTPGVAGRSGIQLVHQNPMASLDPRWPVWRSVAEPMRGDRADRRERADELLTRVGLRADLHTRRPRELSGGQCQRVTIARSLAADPRLIILDEAVSALDVSVKNEILYLLNQLRSEERLSFLFVTHDMSAVAQIASSVLVMRRGDIVERGATRAVLNDPQATYTQELMQAVPRFAQTMHANDSSARVGMGTPEVSTEGTN